MIATLQDIGSTAAGIVVVIFVAWLVGWVLTMGGDLIRGARRRGG